MKRAAPAARPDVSKGLSVPKIRAWPLIAALLLGGGIAVGLLAVHTDVFTARDAAVSAQLHDLDSGWIHGAVAVLSAAFSPIAGIVIIVIWAAALLVRRQRLAALSTVCILCAGWGAALVIKHLVARPRPPFGVADGYSFPSGHTALAVAVVCAAFLLVRGTDLRDTVATAGTLLVAAVAFARVISGAHYLTDTLGAVLCSAGVLVAVSGVWHAWAPALVRRYPMLPGPGETLTPRLPVPATPNLSTPDVPPAPPVPEVAAPSPGPAAAGPGHRAGGSAQPAAGPPPA